MIGTLENRMSVINRNAVQGCTGVAQEPHLRPGSGICEQKPVAQKLVDWRSTAGHNVL